jgi:hypothetical protein
MVSKSQIDRLSSRIEALAPRRSAGVAVIFRHGLETDEEATARHYRENPEDHAKTQSILVSFVEPKERRPPVAAFA